MAVPVEPSVYTGTAGQWRTTSKLLWNTAEAWLDKNFRPTAFYQTPFLKALGVTAFGQANIIKGGGIGNLGPKKKGTGKGIKFVPPCAQFTAPYHYDTAGGTHVGRMGTINPEYLTPSMGSVYAWKRIFWSIFLPEELVMDNKGTNRLQNIMENEFNLTKMSAATDINNAILGNASAPTSSPDGLPYLISVTQPTSGTHTPGGIYPGTDTEWANQYRACTAVGGGGEMDRPIALLRKLQALFIDVRELGGSSDAQLGIATRGAYQYLLRAAYADTTAQGNAGLRNAAYNAASIDHIVIDGSPMIYDHAATVPTGATASTECIYLADLREMGLAVHNGEFFRVEPWEAPRAHDNQRYFQTNIWLRYTPFVTWRDIQGVLYNIPANPDAA